jgi:hypothetical protein
MRVLAARFRDRRGASVALRQLQRRMALSEQDVGIAPLGMPGEADHGEAVLAGRFPEDRLAEVRELVHEAGGEIVANVDERWTQPWRQRSNPATDVVEQGRAERP